MATSYSQQTPHEPIYHWSTSLEAPPQHPTSFITDPDSMSDCAELSDYGLWESNLFGCSKSPKYLLTAALLPGMSGAYTARSIGKFPIAIGIGMSLFIYCGIVFAVVWATADDEPSVTIAGLELGLWQNLAVNGFMNFFPLVFMLRGWFRTFHGIPGSKPRDCAASFGFSCCALAQMAEHTARVSQQQYTHKSTLPGYAA